ncbi:hypothetical protein DWZ37_04680 [Clostridiaceae bacterium AF31-3BH]|nr:hypothetical protein DWZ37_04680 [Clostridiaceae bacterium AF31-3BH]
MQNRFEQFSQNIIAMHTGSAGAFDPARMMFPPEEKEVSSQEMQNLYMTNVYRIQNLTEENYLYRQNFQFLTQMFEKQIHKKLYPQVERQVEKTIRQELPKAEDRVIREMTKELHTLVKESGVEQLRVLEKEAKEEQKVLLRKIENIYNSSVYVNVQAKNIQNDNISINGRVENGQKTGSATDRNTWLRTQITSVLEQKDQQTVKNLTEEILQKVKTKDASVATQQTERVYLEQVLEEYTEGKTDRQQTVRQAAEIIERFARRGQTERRLSEWITADPSISQPKKVQQSEKARSTQLLQWMELAAHSLQPSQHLTSPAAKAMENHPTEEVIRQKTDMAPMEHLSAPEERVAQPSQEVINQAVQNQSPQPQAGQLQDMLQPQIWTAQLLKASQHSTSPAAKAMESHPVEEEAIRQRADVAPMEHLSAPEERVAQPSQAVINQAVQSQSPQPQAGQSQDMSQPQVWTTQTLMSLQHQTSSISSTSPAAKAMESHPVEEEAIRQRADAAPMEHLTAPEERVAQPSQKLVNQAVQNQSPQPQAGRSQDMSHPQTWTTQTMMSLQHPTSSTSPAAKAMESHLAEDLILQRTEAAPMEHLSAPEERVAQPSQKVVNQAVQSQSPQSQVGRLQDMSQPQVWTTQTLLSLQHNSPSSSPEAKAMESHSAEEATQQRTEMVSMEHLTMPPAMSPAPTQVMPQVTTPKPAMIQAHMFPQMQQPPEVPQAASMRRSSPRLQQRTMHHPQSYVMEAAPIIYAEEPKQAADPGEHQVIRKQIREITEHIEEVKKTVAIERQVLTEQQKESVRQVIRSTPSLLTEGEIAVLMKQKVETEISRKMDESMQQMTNRVYRRIEEKLKTERERRGRI